MMKAGMELIFLNRPEPLLPQAVGHVLPSGGGSEILDLSETAVILPTRTAIRKLHEALVRRSEPRAINPPRWFLPMQFTGGEAGAAPASFEQLCWCRVIMERSPDSLAGLFPFRRPPSMDVASASALGSAISSLRADLASAGLSLAQVAGTKDAIPAVRLETLLSLEEQFLAALRRLGFRDRVSLQLEGMKSPRLTSGIRRIVVAGVPDLPRACEAALLSCAEAGVRVEILVHDPDGAGREGFDQAGRPLADWKERDIVIPGDRIHARSDDTELAGAVADLCRASGGTRRTTAVGMTSPELALVLKESLESNGLDAFNPAGESLDATAPGRLLGLLLLHLEEGDFRSAMRLMHHADMTSWLSRPGRPFGGPQLARLDELQKLLIPSTLRDLLARWPQPDERNAARDELLRGAISDFLDLSEPLAQARGADALLAFLREVHGDHPLAPAAAEAASCIREWIRTAGDLVEGMSVREVIPLLLKTLSSGLHAEEKSPEAIELQGWLELLWEDAPHLVVAGMSDGLVPEVRPPDPFLPEKSRRLLGMPDNAYRLTRDSYLIRSLMASRPEGEGAGRVDFLFARHDAEGAFRKPSRLLLRCADTELPARVRHLFADTGRRPASPWRAAWKLEVRGGDLPDHLSASSIKDYLSCPARWYFRRVGGLRKSDFAVEEIDPMDFGILLHAVLQEFGNDTVLREIGDEDKIAEAFKNIWLRIFRERFGDSPPLALVYQREIGLRRLAKAAEKQAELRAEGWRIAGCELEFEGFRPAGTDALTMPLPVKGRIDRIDRRENADGTVEWRILDYKSGEKAESPDDSHYRRLGIREDASVYSEHEKMMLFREVKGKKNGEKVVKSSPGRWTDLQIPIYVLIGEAVMGGACRIGNLEITGGTVSGGYFLLPADLKDTGIVTFEGFEGWRESATRCLSGVSKAVTEGIFWPPRRPKHDDFEELFFDRMDDSDEDQRTAVPPGRRGV